MDYKQLLIEGCRKVGVDIDDAKAEAFLKYKDLLIEWNKKINLTSITEEKDIIIKHFIDSIAIIKYIKLTNKKVIDIGTGAGFPGIPLKIIDNSIEVTLVDSLNKRIIFLNEVIQQLNLKNIFSIHSRAEDLGINNNYREKYDICVSRAVANLSTLCEYSLPLVNVGGVFISQKGPNIEDELNESKKAISVLGGELEKVERIQLPFTDIIHTIIFIKKVRQCPVKYPRKSGKPTKEPIK